MTDRELLELAAKAAGQPLGAWFEDWREAGFFIPGTQVLWNPLASDGDALRLAVKLHIGMRSHGPNHWQQPNVAVALWEAGDQAGRISVEHGNDPQRAIRRAIVRAAAEIGRGSDKHDDHPTT